MAKILPFALIFLLNRQYSCKLTLDLRKLFNYMNCSRQMEKHMNLNPERNERYLETDEKRLPPGFPLLFFAMQDAHKKTHAARSSACLESPNDQAAHLHQCASCAFIFLCKFEHCLLKGKMKTRFSLCETCERTKRQADKLKSKGDFQTP